MVYTIDELKQRIAPVAEKYALRAVYLFGSYAQNLQTEMVKIFQNFVQVRTSDLP